MNSDNYKILLVEDEVTHAEIVKKYLAKEGLATHIISNGEEVISWLKSNDVHLVLLDLNLPGKDGLEVFREIRELNDVPIIISTARSHQDDRLKAWKLGPEDYICKPYYNKELILRVKNTLNRIYSADSSNTRALDIESKVPKHGFAMDEENEMASLNGQPIKLSSLEFRLLYYFYSNKGVSLNREELKKNVYPSNRVVSDKTIDAHVKNLRKRIRAIDSDLNCIKSEYGVGFKFTSE